MSYILLSFFSFVAGHGCGFDLRRHWRNCSRSLNYHLKCDDDCGAAVSELSSFCERVLIIPEPEVNSVHARTVQHLRQVNHLPVSLEKIYHLWSKSLHLLAINVP